MPQVLYKQYRFCILFFLFHPQSHLYCTIYCTSSSYFDAQRSWYKLCYLITKQSFIHGANWSFNTSDQYLVEMITRYDTSRYNIQDSILLLDQILYSSHRVSAVLSTVLYKSISTVLYKVSLQYSMNICTVLYKVSTVLYKVSL